jgi:RNA-binding protein
MPLHSARRKQLLAQSHELKANIHVGSDGVTDGVVELIRQALASNEMVKVRLGAEDRDEVGQFVDDLVARVPCELVKRIGFVAILFRGDDRDSDMRNSKIEEGDVED